jgi:hypothetical protein
VAEPKPSVKMQGEPGQVNLFAVDPQSTVIPIGPLYIPAGFDPSQLITIISVILQAAPQLIALIKTLIDAFQPKPSPNPPSPPNPRPTPSPFGSQPS